MSSDDKLIIETPEQTVLEFGLAGIGSRSLALAIDTLLQIAVVISVGASAGLITYAGFFPQIGKQWVYAIFIFVVFLSQFGYFALFETIWNGQTPGKRWTHLRVIADSGRPVGAQGAILRNLMRIVDSLPSVYAVGIVTSLISAQNKRVGDYVAGTVVIHERPLQDGQSLWETPTTHPLTTTQTRAITVAEIQLVETFLERRSSIQPDVRRSIAHQIAERMRQGWSAPQETLQDPEKFLEAFAQHCRSVARYR